MPDHGARPIDALLDAYADQRRALRRVLALVACHPDEIAADPSLVLRALDAHPTAIAICPPGCTGTCTRNPHPTVWTRYNALNPRKDELR
ncbi:hypothetical protein [Streptomyces sp. bgisy154]|uniref:hypothetical protein n=1 Tax=Streptomyces sp. bgisy154 TaxID=3413794 RepID=UPI003D7102F7